MTATHTSNKQILEAIERQTQGIEALVAALSQNVTPQAQAPTPPVLTDSVAPERVNDADTIKVDKKYRNHMMAKIQAKANDAGTAYMFYARKNLAGETKLAYCQADRWSKLKDKGLIGPISLVEPS